MTSKALAEKVVPGEHLALFNYYKVESVEGSTVTVKDQNGATIRIPKSMVDLSMVSTSQWNREYKINKRRIVSILEGAGHLPFCVTFHKKVEPNTVADAIEGRDMETQAKRRKVLRELMEGEKRVMHARLWRNGDDAELEFGRVKVVDLEATAADPVLKPQMRLVDTRSITELIIEGIRFYV